MLKLIIKYLILIIFNLNLALITVLAANSIQHSTSKTNTKIPADFIPEKVFLYLELTNPFSLLVARNLTSKEQQTLLEVAFDLTPEEINQLAQAKLALALLPNKNPKTIKTEDLLEKDPSSELPFTIIGFFETPNPKVTNKMTVIINESLNNLLGYTNLKIETNSLPTSITGLEKDSAVILSLSSQFSEFLKEINSKDFNSLANAPEFQKFKITNDNDSNLVIYLNGIALKEILYNSDLSRNDKTTYEIIARILGISAVKATGVKFNIIGKDTSRFSTIVDKEQLGFFPMFGSVALSDFHLAKLASDKTEVFFALKIDPNLTYKSVLEAIFPSFSGEVDPLSQMGVNISQDIISNLTGELALSFSVSNTAELLTGRTNIPKLQLTGILEVKNVKTFSSAFAKLSEQVMKSSIETQEYKGFTLYNQQDIFWTYVENKMLVGTMAGIHQTVDSILEKHSLANVSAFQNNLAKFSPNGLGVLYLDLAPFVKASPAPVKLLAGLVLGNFPAQLIVFGGRDKEELYIETSLTGFAAPIIIAAVVGVAVTIPYLSRASVINEKQEIPKTIDSVEKSTNLEKKVPKSK